ARVRTGLLERVSGLRPSWGRWVYALAGAAFVAVIVVGVVSMHVGRKPGVRQVVESDPLPAAPAVPLYQADNDNDVRLPLQKTVRHRGTSVAKRNIETN